MDAQAQPLDPHAGEHDAVAAQRGEARPDAHDRHLQEGRRVLRDPRHPQAAQLDLGGARADDERLDLHLPLEGAPQQVLDEPRAPVRGAPERVDRGRAQDEREEEELAAAGHGLP